MRPAPQVVFPICFTGSFGVYTSPSMVIHKCCVIIFRKIKNSHILPRGQWYAPSAIDYSTYDALSCTILHYLALSCIILHYLALTCTILHYLALSCTIMHHLALSCVLFCKSCNAQMNAFFFSGNRP